MFSLVLTWITCWTNSHEDFHAMTLMWRHCNVIRWKGIGDYFFLIVTVVLRLNSYRVDKLLIVVVNRFKYINNNVTNGSCSITMDMTKFSLKATIDHDGLSVYSGHYATSANSCRNFYCNYSKSMEFEMIYIKKTSATAYVIIYEMNWLSNGFWTRTGGWEFNYSHGVGTFSPSHSKQVE